MTADITASSVTFCPGLIPLLFVSPPPRENGSGL